VTTEVVATVDRLEHFSSSVSAIWTTHFCLPPFPCITRLVSTEENRAGRTNDSEYKAERYAGRGKTNLDVRPILDRDCRWDLCLALRRAKPYLRFTGLREISCNSQVQARLAILPKMGKTLDDAYAGFEAKYCSTCQDRTARLENWKYSREWHYQEGLRLRRLISKFRSGPLKQ